MFNWLADANGQGVQTPSGDKLVPALNLVVSLAPDRYRHVDGLLGNWGVSAAKEFVGRNGRAYPQSVITAGDVDVATPRELRVIYGEFGASWRITRRESLFRYPSGKTTGSYTIRGFPRRYLTAASLPSGERAAGLAAWRAAGITNARLLAACELDVGATGDKGFAIGDRRLQTAAGLPASSPGTPGTSSALHPIALASVTSDLSVPELAYDPSSKDTYVAWLDGGSASVDVCVVTAAAPDCNGGAGPYHLVDSLASSGGAAAVYSDPRLVIEPGGTVVVVAGIDGASASADPSGYGGAGVVAWSSPSGGAAFASAGQGGADGGDLLASAVGSGDVPAGGAIALDGTDIGVYGNDYPFASGFTDFALSASAPSPTPVPDSTGDFGQQLGITGNQLASVPDPAAPGEYIVVAVGGASGATPGCAPGTGDATGYGVAVGTPAGLQSQSAWASQDFVPISCRAFSPVLAGGGPAGGPIGLLEDEGPGLAGSGADGVYFRPFDTAAEAFGAPVLVSSETAQTLTGAEELDLSQDSAADEYATWADGRGTVLSYSSTAGASWRPPVAVPLAISPDDDVVVAGVGGGAAELAYTADSAAGQQLYLVPVSYAGLTGS